MRIFYDTEFVENGTTIDLVSIGMVAEDGRELYAVSSEFDSSKLLINPWLVDNVWPSLPTKPCPAGHRCLSRGKGHLDYDHPDVDSRAQIARRVRDFVLGTDPEQLPHVELWAWYGAYDHVALAQLFGRMIDLPEGMPMWTNDLRQECERLGNPQLPEQPDGLHNALADARHNLVRARVLDALAGSEA
ncbi:3'-5' exoribonuclease [Streptomyces sp. ME02-8801-2C]|uniref:3'-5' exoribonuclease n=1 Tax=Streptomyces sp. ME02-8801-2C TaxID=3028680 RepID=UPI0029B32742|nr:3'-5' exoribonuclease [Streptomyces sp. ME02-8801-2C]MDX3455073.1 3'-5' exoribonuclease [Streptomyces sp. ME02-8801-2C]